MARAGSELGPEVLPAGFSFVDAVDVDGTDGSGVVSHVYGGRGGPEGPVLYVLTGLRVAQPSAEMAGLAQEAVPGLSGTFPVTVAHGADGGSRTYVTIDASPAGVVRVIGEDLPQDEVLRTAERLVAGAG